MSAVTAVETIKANSRGLRGSLVQSLSDLHTGGLRDDDQHLIKLHGSYQQDDRDLREERRAQKLEPLHTFMARVRLPGGIATPSQWLALDQIARTLGNGTLKLTTRQTFQVHGVFKQDLKAMFQTLDASLMDCIAACGDVNRNVISGRSDVAPALEAQIANLAKELSEALLPATTAYREIWLNGEKATAEEPEPLYGPTYLPRKFKAAIAIPPINDVDVFAHDLGFIAIIEKGVLVGFNLTAGGGLGASHGEAATYPRLADVIGFLPPEQLIEVAKAVLLVQRDHGDRTNRKHARLKYTIDTHGLPWFVQQLHTHLSQPLQPARPYRFTQSADRFGWLERTDGLYDLTLRIQGGRLGAGADHASLDGLRSIAEVHQGYFRITPNQNLSIAAVTLEARESIDALVRSFGLDLHRRMSLLQRDALACVAMPTCPLAMAEAERYLPHFAQRLTERWHAHGLAEQTLSLRISGCPNGCSRPYLAEIALVGKGPGRYNLHLGGRGDGTRLNQLYRENLDEEQIFALLETLIARYADTRLPFEAFGDFFQRTLAKDLQVAA